MPNSDDTDGSKGQGKAPSGRRRGRRKGLEIRPGSVKEARALARLSLGQVARDDVSRTAIYFIETGRSRPSRETLELIALRTGQPIDFFLSGAAGTERHPELRIAELERLLATGDNEGVVRAAEVALAQSLDPDTEARIKLIASTAYLRLAQPVMGRRLAVAARSHFERTSDAYMIAEALGREAQAAGLMQDGFGVQIAQGALATCRTLNPVPKVLEARLLRVLGHQLLTERRWTEAIACYEEAVATGEVVQDMQQLSLLYSGMSLAHQELGQFGEATRLAQKALALHETLQDRLSMARSLNNLGHLLVRVGELGAARGHIDRALRIFDELRVETGKAMILTSLAELESEEGRLETAWATAHRAREVAERLSEHQSVAEAHRILGKVAARQGRHAVADEAFAVGLAAAERSGMAARVVDVNESYAEVLEARGDLVAANRHLKRALAAHRPCADPVESKIAIA